MINKMKLVKGKCFSACDRGQRKKSDFYETPYSMVWQLLERENFEGGVLDPAAGDGAILKAVLDIIDISTIGIEKRLPGGKTRGDITYNTDFLAMDRKDIGTFLDTCPNVICNPPFSFALDFIQKCMNNIKTNGKMAFLLPLSYLHGQKRFLSGIWFFLREVLVFTRYPLLGEELRTDGKYRTGMMAYAWYIFDQSSHAADPKISWIDNNKYVLKKGM